MGSFPMFSDVIFKRRTGQRTCLLDARTRSRDTQRATMTEHRHCGRDANPLIFFAFVHGRPTCSSYSSGSTGRQDGATQTPSFFRVSRRVVIRSEPRGEQHDANHRQGNSCGCRTDGQTLRTDGRTDGRTRCDQHQQPYFSIHSASSLSLCFDSAAFTNTDFHVDLHLTGARIKKDPAPSTGISPERLNIFYLT